MNGVSRLDVNWGMEKGQGACVMGAAAVALGLDIDKHLPILSEPLKEQWPWLTRIPFDHEIPEGICKVFVNCYISLLVLMNDELKWDRERIANWVELVEPKESTERMNDGKCAHEATDHLGVDAEPACVLA